MRRVVVIGATRTVCRCRLASSGETTTHGLVFRISAPTVGSSDTSQTSNRLALTRSTRFHRKYRACRPARSLLAARSAAARRECLGPSPGAAGAAERMTSAPPVTTIDTLPVSFACSRMAFGIRTPCEFPIRTISVVTTAFFFMGRTAGNYVCDYWSTGIGPSVAPSGSHVPELVAGQAPNSGLTIG